MGYDVVREKLATDETWYNYEPRSRIAHNWLRSVEDERRDAREAETLSVAKDANTIALSAAVAASDANDIARSARKIAWIAAIAAIVAAIAAIKWR